MLGGVAQHGAGGAASSTGDASPLGRASRASRACVALAAFTMSARLAACASVDPPIAANDAATEDVGFVLPDTGVPFEYPDSTAGAVARRLAGCRGVEPDCHGDLADPAFGRAPALDFAQVLGLRSTERPDLLRVQPGDPSRSWLYLKVAGARDAGVETPMPLGSEGDPAFAALLAAWIADGAPDPFVDGGRD